MIFSACSIFQLDLVRFLNENNWFSFCWLNWKFSSHEKVWFLWRFQELRHLDFNLCICLIGIGLGISNISLYCYLGKLATESYAKMADCVYDSNWYKMPLNLQKYLVLMIANAQAPLHYHGFKIAVLSLETLTKVGKIQIKIHEFDKNQKVISNFIFKLFQFFFGFWNWHFLNFAATSSNIHLLHDVQNINIQINIHLRFDTRISSLRPLNLTL